MYSSRLNAVSVVTLALSKVATGRQKTVKDYSHTEPPTAPLPAYYWDTSVGLRFPSSC